LSGFGHFVQKRPRRNGGRRPHVVSRRSFRRVRSCSVAAAYTFVGTIAIRAIRSGVLKLLTIYGLWRSRIGLRGQAKSVSRCAAQRRKRTTQKENGSRNKLCATRQYIQESNRKCECDYYWMRKMMLCRAEADTYVSIVHNCVGVWLRRDLGQRCRLHPIK
jgi:hypothetical protein